MNTNEGSTVNGTVEYLDLAMPETVEDEQYWKDEERWTFGSLPDIELLHLYGLQFGAYEKTTGLYETMVKYAPETSSDAKTGVAVLMTADCSRENPKIVRVLGDGGEKCQRKTFWMRIRRYLQKRTQSIRRLFSARR